MTNKRQNALIATVICVLAFSSCTLSRQKAEPTPEWQESKGESKPIGVDFNQLSKHDE